MTGFEAYLDDNPQLVELWTEVEHIRWNAFHFVNGWEYAEKRDDSRKQHNCLLPFEQLTREEQDKDTVALTLIPQIIG